MIKFITGNIFDSEADALVNTVNTQGIMGKGIALQFKKSFPHNFQVYAKACKNNDIDIGKLLFVKDESLLGGTKWVINFPTKTSWRKPSEYIYIKQGLEDLVNRLPEFPIQSIAIPPLGSGNGGLDWQRVKSMIQDKLESLPLDIIVYEPNANVKEVMKKERVKLTEARALLLYVMYDLVKNGELVSEFSCEKVSYFLQRFGAQKYFNLKFEPNFYGPYSGKIRYVINYLNGSYIMGYSAMDKKPFEPLSLVADGMDEVRRYVESNSELKAIADNTIRFLSGFYSDFALELLSSIDFLRQSQKVQNVEEIKEAVSSWNDRKRTMFSDDRYINISVNHLEKAQFIN
ncbi:MAG: macro domain-containing protein [Bacteroidota bacterium]